MPKLQTNEIEHVLLPALKRLRAGETLTFYKTVGEYTRIVHGLRQLGATSTELRRVRRDGLA
jgi:hypothetical protein